ncbi:MAG: DNA polymerase III subunit delta [Anaerolineae bacterium]
MFYIFHGSDEFSSAEALARFKTGLGEAGIADLNATELDGKTMTLGELAHHANALPFLAPRRLVIVRHFLTRLGAKAEAKTADQLVELLHHLPPTTDLIFVEPAALKKNHPILKLGLTIEDCVHTFNPPQKHHLAAWIERRAKQKGAQIERRAVTALANVVGDDLRALDNELEKLSLFVNNRRRITLADVEQLCPYTADSETLAMANAIGRRDAKTALDQLHKRLAEGENPLAILGGIAAQFRGLLEVTGMAAAGLSPAQIAAQKGWRSDYPAKMRLKEARNFSTTRLIDIFNTLLETDVASKTGLIDQTLALDVLISRLCGLN